MKRFKIYTPKNKFYWSNNLIVYSLLVFCFLPVGIEVFMLKHENDQVSGFSRILAYGIPIMLFVSVIFGIISFFQHRPLRGMLDGEIIFESERIIINGKEFDIASLTKISFVILDYKGMFIGGRGDLNGRKSNGVGNRIALYKNGTPQVYYFQLEYKGQLKNIKEQLIQYHLAGKLHFLQLIDILGISKYDEIQEFKKEIGIVKK